MKKYTRIISLLLVVVFMTGLSIRVDAAEMERKIVVNGTGSISVKPDTAEIRFTSISRDKNQKVATSNNAKKVDNLIKGLKASGIKDKDIKTEGIYIEQDYNYNQEKPILKGYVVSNTVVVTLRDISKVGKIIDLGVELGIDSLGGISYSSSKADDIYNDALELAIKNGKKKADRMALATGNKIKSISKLAEKTNYMDFKVEESADMENVKAGSETIVKVQNIIIEAVVEIEYIF